MSKKVNYDLLECVFIFVVFCGIMFTDEFIFFIKSFGGRLMAVCLILFATSHNALFGIIVGILFMYFGKDEKDSFTQKENCKNGKVVYKRQNVPTDMIQFIFPGFHVTDIVHQCTGVI